MKYLLSLIISGALVVSGFGQTRNVLVNTNNAVVQPTNFWSADAVNARSGLGLGTAATNPASAFQPSSLVLSNLASSNAVNLTNLRSTNIVGTVALASNVTGVVAITNGGTGATNAATARTNLGLSATDKVSFDTVSAKESTGFTSATLNGIQWQSMYPASNGLIGLYGSDAQGTTTFGINIGTMSGTTAEVALFNANRITFYEPLEFNNSTNTAITRTNLGLGLDSSVAFSNLTLSNGVATNLAFTLGSTDRGFYATTGPDRIVTVVGGIDALQVFSNSVETATGINLSVSGSGSFGTNVQIGGPLSFSGTNAAGNAATTRTNLSLGWPALTNSNAGTGLVSVDTNGEVVSPTNFWQVAPITTTFIESQPTTNSSTNIAASRFLHIHSLATNIVNVTNTIVLPTNGSTFVGDVALVVHQGPTSSLTRVRTTGSTNDIITMTRYNEAVELIYYNSAWQFNHNESFTEPIYFSGTNAAGHAAESRTNLGLGANAVPTFTAMQLESGPLTVISGTNTYIEMSDGNADFYVPLGVYNNDGIVFQTNNNSASNTRTNLGIPLPALTNTNNASFQRAILKTNTTPAAGANLGDAKAWLEISVVTNSVTNSFRIPVFQ